MPIFPLPVRSRLPFQLVEPGVLFQANARVAMSEMSTAPSWSTSGSFVRIQLVLALLGFVEHDAPKGPTVEGIVIRNLGVCPELNEIDAMKLWEYTVEPVVAFVKVTATVPDTVLPLTVRDDVIVAFSPSKVTVCDPGGGGGSAVTINCTVVEGRLQLQPPPDTPIESPAIVVLA